MHEGAIFFFLFCIINLVNVFHVKLFLSLRLKTYSKCIFPFQVSYTVMGLAVSATSADHLLLLPIYSAMKKYLPSSKKSVFAVSFLKLNLEHLPKLKKTTKDFCHHV